MGYFYQEHQTQITKLLEKSLAGTLETIIMGGSANADPFATACTEIDNEFRQFLDRREMDGHIQGVPTQASLDGVNHRFKRPYVKANPDRPSFIDTGLYQSSFKSWVD